MSASDDPKRLLHDPEIGDLVRAAAEERLSKKRIESVGGQLQASLAETPIRGV